MRRRDIEKWRPPKPVNVLFSGSQGSNVPLERCRSTSSGREYDPFTRGRFPVGVRTIQALDTARNRLFTCEVWYPAAAQHAGQDIAPATQDFFTVPPSGAPRNQMAVRHAAPQPGTYPLIIFSHSSGGRRRQSTFLCTHLSSHGYVVAALDHSEVVAPELMRKEGGNRRAKGCAGGRLDRQPRA
jgi:predicted dienelactone hydrolase